MTKPVKKLLLMRHGKSDWDSSVTRDFDRPLARRGYEDVPRMARWLRKQFGVAECWISSPARRAATTADLLAEHCGFNSTDIIPVDEIYEASHHDLRAVIEAYAGEATSLLLVGHNPGLEALLAYLLPEEPPRSPSGKLMTTAAIAVLECDGWDLQRGSCRLLHCQRLKELHDQME